MDCPICKKNSLKSKILTDQMKTFNCTKCNGNWIRLDDYLKWLTSTNQKEYELITQENLIKNSETNPEVTNIKLSSEPLTDKPSFNLTNISNSYLESNLNNQKNSPRKIADNCIEGYEKYCSLKARTEDKIQEIRNAKLCPDCGKILIKYRINNSLNFRVENCGTCSGNWFDNNKWEFLYNNNLLDKVYRFFTISWQKKIRDEATKIFLNNKYQKKFGDNDYTKIKNIKDWLDNNASKRELLAFLLKSEPYKL